MEKYDFTKRHLYGENHHHITKILGLFQASKLEEAFVRKFYATVPMLELNEDDYRLYVNLAKSAFNFFNNFAAKAKVKLYQENQEDHTVIEILSADMPFIFDSVICLLNRLNIDIDRVTHPSIAAQRDDKGNLIDINDSGKHELIIQIRTIHALEPKVAEQIEIELKTILGLVAHAVEDWQKIIAQVGEYTAVNDEQQEFLKLMKDKYFVFLGSCSYDFQNQKKSLDKSYGILKAQLDVFEGLFDATIFTDNFFKQSEELLLIGKLNKASTIHRDANIDYLCLKVLDEQKKIKKVFVFIGLFTSILYYQSATLIPIIREKLSYILKIAGFSAHSYAGKELVSIVEALPRDELFQTSAEKLYPMIMEIYALSFSPELRIFLRTQGETLSCLLFLPTVLTSSENMRKIKAALAFEYGPIVSQYFAQINNSRLCYYHFFIDTKGVKVNETEIPKVEQELIASTKPWEDSLYEILYKAHGKVRGRQMFARYNSAFPLSYRENASYNEIILEDIENIDWALKNKQIVFKIVPCIPGKVNIAQLKIYHTSELNLSSIMPMLQNMGLNVAAEQIYVIQALGEDELWLHQFILQVNENEVAMLENSKANLEEVFLAMWEKRSQNDLYNQLIMTANLTHRQVTLLRAFAEYLYQIKIGYSREYIGQVLNKHTETAKLIIMLFYCMFDPKLHSNERQVQIEALQAKLEQSLNLIHDNVEDQIIRRIIDLVNNILRTNYFVVDQNNEFKDYVSFKINSEKIMAMPLPKPYREIFVYSSSFEGIHLRGGKVARGGLRWSDRAEDYRTEVLGLMKTQIVKNSVIVPTGAKGGFILKDIADLNREEIQAKAIECYKNFLRGILDITDNIINNKSHHPKHVVHYDEEDPYLVVAADKGTATFSDTANAISAEYNFWLGDAFASGGSKGYDHKKMGITAKGAWISVVRHFREMNVDIDSQEFTVVGIGDMAGDVFGNGMLLSDNIKLVAAFNHMHIFIDPNPDSKKSFAERQRMFNLPRSTWLDYDATILSPGAKIFDRKAKDLELTKEIKALLKLNVDKIKPDELIRVLLTAEVDLLWNGGIGTYVKGSFETNEQVGDKANDNLRCNGADLRCKIVGEGGNLGFTQYGRIEYARAGGRINTDAIDNSAGVDCSDHEVNIKIALHQAFNNKLITEDERNKLLESMTDDVADLVLRDNRTQTRAITIAQQQSYEILAQQESFIDILEEYGLLDRKLECLPTKQQFISLHSAKLGLTRPELAVLLAYSKNAIYNDLIKTRLAEEEYFANDLLAYFPEEMQKKFASVIEQHPLRKEIITTAITNSMVNRIDTFYLHLAIESGGYKFCDIARAYTVTRDLFDIHNLWLEINKLDGIVPVEMQVKLYIIIKKFIMRSTNWLLRNYRGKLDIASVIEQYQDKIKQLRDIIGSCVTGSFKGSYELQKIHLSDMKIPENIACKVSLLSPLSSAYNIVEVSNKYEVPVNQVADIYFEIGNRFDIAWLRNVANNLTADNNWEKLALRGFKDELYDVHRRIVASIFDYITRHEGNLEKWYHRNDKHIKLFDRFINEIKSQTVMEYSMIELALKKLHLVLIK